MAEKALISDWRTVKFGDVVRLSKSRCQDPLTEGYDRFVGLEHLEPGDLRIHSWGNVANGVTFTNVFQPGQVLFGKRRAYQRKVAVADFAGVCSSDIYVLESQDNNTLIPELLPFICQTEAFFEHAVGTSAGSLSPRTNWTSLAGFEFALPPLGEQKKILATLVTASEQVNAYRSAVAAARLLARATLEYAFSQQSGWASARIGVLGQVQLGRQRAPKYTTGKFNKPYLRVVNILDGRLDLRDVEQMDFDVRDFSRYKIQRGDILITEGDIVSVHNVGRSAIWNDEIPDCCIQNTLIRFRPGDLLIPEFALAAFRFAFYKSVFAKAANATTVAHLGAERFSKIQISFPGKEQQKEIASQLANVYLAERRLQERLSKSIDLSKALREMLCGGDTRE